MDGKIKFKKYRRRKNIEHFEVLKKAIKAEIVEAGDWLVRIKNNIPLEEQRFLELLFSGKHQSSILDALLDSDFTSPEEIRLLLGQKFVDAHSGLSGADETGTSNGLP
jgi:hypothetical protein